MSDRATQYDFVEFIYALALEYFNHVDITVRTEKGNVELLISHMGHYVIRTFDPPGMETGDDFPRGILAGMAADLGKQVFIKSCPVPRHDNE